MSNARFILVALICASPIVLFLDGPIMDGVLAGIAALGIAILSLTLRPGETEFLIAVTRPLAVIVALPALWMLIQVLPLRLFAHPIWSSAEAAIGQPIAGSISIDTGASAMALGQYLTLGAVALLSAAVSVDRHRAEWVLFSLTTGTALIAVIMAVNDLLGLAFLSAGEAPLARAQAINCAALGAIFAASWGIRTIERHMAYRTSPGQPAPALMRPLVACGVVLAVCAVALALAGASGVIVVAGYGLVTLVAAMVIRGLALKAWGISAFAVLALGFAVILVAKEPSPPTQSLSLAFAAHSPASLTSMSQRMLDDAPLTGTGAGTFAAIMPIYRDVDDPVAYFTPPTAISAFALELGKPMLWLIEALVVGSIIVLFRASLRRGRDSFYPAAGASCLITLLGLSFMNAGLLGTATAVIAAAALGLAVAQSRSRTI